MKDTIISIALADDQLLFRKGISAILQSVGNIKVVLEADNGRELLDKLKTHSNDISLVLLDLEMPVMNGVQCMKEMSKSFPNTKTIVLSVHNEPTYITKMIELGARAYLQKNAEPSDVISTIEHVHQTGFYLNEQTMMAIGKGFSLPRKKISLVDDGLTQREIEIMRLICAQYTTPEIAEKLFISERTVDGHRNNLLQKTGRRNVAGLVVYAIQEGIYKADEKN